MTITVTAMSLASPKWVDHRILGEKSLVCARPRKILNEIQRHLNFIFRSQKALNECFQARNHVNPPVLGTQLKEFVRRIY